MAILTLTTADAGTTVPLGGTASWSVFGTDGVDNIQVAAGTAATISGGAGVDVINLTGGSADYTVVLSGTSAVFTHTATGKTVSVPVTSGGDSVSFGTGTAVTLKSTGSVVTLGTQTITTTSAPVTGASGSGSGGSGGGVGQAFSLTANTTPDILSLTTGNDTVTGAAGTFQASDVIVDSTTTDSDSLTISMNSYASTQATITNVETINAVGVFTAAGIDLANVTGTKTVNLSVGIAGGTGTVAGATAAKVATGIVAGSNIGTLNVNTTAITTGTGGNVNVDRGSATTATIGATAATGSDTYTVNVAANQTTVLLGGSAGTDTFTVNLGGGASTLTITNNAAGTGDINALNLNSNTAANTVTLSSATHEIAGNGSADVVTVGGTQALTIRGNGDVVGGTTARTAATQGEAFTKATGAGTLTFDNTAALGAATFFNRALFDVFNITGVATGNNITLNENTTLKMSVANGTQTYDVDNNSLTTGLAAGAGTLKVELAGSSAANATQASFTTGVNVGTTVFTNNTIDSTITTLDIATTATSTGNTVVVSGSKNLTIGTFTADTGEVLTAANLTGNLVATIGASGATVQGGSGNDTITGGGAADSIGGAAGNDVLSGGAGAINDTLTGGLGNDTYIITGTGTDTVTDFSASATNGTDIIALSVGGLTGISALSDGNSAAVAAGATAKVNLVTAAKTLAAGDNVIVISGTFASSAALETAIEAAGSRQLTFASANAIGDDVIIVWTDGTNGHVGFYNAADAATTLGAAGTYTELVTLTGVTSVDALASANFQFVA